MATVIKYIKNLFGKPPHTVLQHDDMKVTLEDVILNLQKDVDVQTSTPLESPMNYTVYVNKKNQLVKISKKQNKSISFAGADMDEIHEILSFDVDTLPEVTQHTVTNEELIRVPELHHSRPKTNIFNYNPGGSTSQVEETKVGIPDEEEEDLPTFGGKPAPRK